MKPKFGKWKRAVLAASSALLLNAITLAGANDTHQLAAGEKAKIAGTILSRDGDLIRLRDKNSGELIVVNINDTTKIKREGQGVSFDRHGDMDVTAMLPGLTIRAEGIGNSKGQLDATTITFSPNAFTADAADSSAVAMLNKRVSDLDDYKNEFQVDVFFAEGSAVLDKKAIRDLANLADIAKPLKGYMIEIAGYAANSFSKETDQQLSEQRAAAVAHYFLETKGIPMRRILVPVAYGTTHPVASNEDPKGRELNRHVDVKVLVNKSPAQGM